MKSFLFCPNPDCKAHLNPPMEKRWYRRSGYHHNQRYGRIPRVRCRFCGKSFSQRSFALDFWSQQDIPWDTLLEAMKEHLSLRKIAKEWKCTHKLVSNRIARAARLGIATHAVSINEKPILKAVQATINIPLIEPKGRISLNVKMLGKTKKALKWELKPLATPEEPNYEVNVPPCLKWWMKPGNQTPRRPELAMERITINLTQSLLNSGLSGLTPRPFPLKTPLQSFHTKIWKRLDRDVSRVEGYWAGHLATFGARLNPHTNST